MKKLKTYKYRQLFLFLKFTWAAEFYFFHDLWILQQLCRCFWCLSYLTFYCGRLDSTLTHTPTGPSVRPPSNREGAKNSLEKTRLSLTLFPAVLDPFPEASPFSHTRKKDCEPTRVKLAGKREREISWKTAVAAGWSRRPLLPAVVLMV